MIANLNGSSFPFINLIALKLVHPSVATHYRYLSYGGIVKIRVDLLMPRIICEPKVTYYIGVTQKKKLF